MGRPKNDLATGPSRFGVNPDIVEEPHGEQIQSFVVKRGVGRGPRNRTAPNRPDLGHDAGNVSRKSPSLNEGPNAVGTHDVNHEMIAEAYSRGLRIGISRSVKRKSLGFVFGS